MAEAAVLTTSPRARFTQLPDPLRCHICSRCIQDAVSLSQCMHTFCKQCISQLDNTELNKIAGVDSTELNKTAGVTCPTCLSFTDLKHITPNHFMNCLVEKTLTHKSEMAEDKTQLQCMQCGNHNVIAICQDCDDNLCQNCHHRHVRLKGFQDHKVSSLSEVDSDNTVFHISGYCSKHPDNVIELYCIVCNETICTPCKYKEHVGHKTEDVHTALLRLRHNVEKDLSIIKTVINQKENVLCSVENQIEDMSHNKSETYSRILSHKNNIVKRFTQLVNEEFDKLVRHLDEVIDSQIKDREMYKDNLQSNLSCDKNVYAWIKTILNKTDGSGLLKELQSGLVDRMKQMKCPPLQTANKLDLCEFNSSDITKVFSEPILGTMKYKTVSPQEVNIDKKVMTKDTIKYELQQAMENSILSSDDDDEIKEHNTTFSSENTALSIRPHLTNNNNEDDKDTDSNEEQYTGSTDSDEEIPVHTVKELSVKTRHGLHSNEEINNDKSVERTVFNAAENSPKESKSEPKPNQTAAVRQDHHSRIAKKDVKPATESYGEDIGPKHDLKKAVKSFRVCEHDLRRLFDRQLHHIKDIKIKTTSFRLCVIKNHLWVPCIQDKSIKVVSLSGSIQIIKLHNIHQPRVLHPIKSQRIALAARSGLYILDQVGQVKHRIHKGEIQDVHSDGFVMAAIEKNRIHIWEVSDDRYVHTNTFTVLINPQYCNTFLISHPYIFVGDFRGCTIHRYSVTGQNMGQYESPSVSLRNPTLCMRDCNQNMLVATYKSNRLKVLSHTGELISAIPVDAPPWDVVIIGNTLCVLCENDKILLYKI